MNPVMSPSGASAPYSDEQVIDMVLQGRTEMYELLMRRYNQRLYRVARSIVKDNDEARDVMQDAYVRAYAQLPRFRRESSFATWLTRIAVNEAIARGRARGPLRSIDESEEKTGHVPETLTDTLTPEQQAAQREVGEMLNDLIDALPTPYRVAFILRHVQGLSTQETAECLEITEEVVRMRTHRARALLQRQLRIRLGTVTAAVFPFQDAACTAVVHATLRRLSTSTLP